MYASAQTGDTYAFELFETGTATARAYNRAAGSAAPKRREEEREKPVLKKVKPKTVSQKRREEHNSNLRIGFMIVFVAIVFGVICCQISAGAERYELIRQIDAVEAQIEVAKSENVRLNAELNGKISITKIDSYATDVLGMTKIENYQVECIDLSHGDRVLYSTGAK